MTCIRLIESAPIFIVITELTPENYPSCTINKVLYAIDDSECLILLPPHFVHF